MITEHILPKISSKITNKPWQTVDRPKKKKKKKKKKEHTQKKKKKKKEKKAKQLAPSSPTRWWQCQARSTKTLWLWLGPLWYIWKWSSAHVYARGRKQCCTLHLLLMKSVNKTETTIYWSVVCSLFPKAIFLTFTSSWIYILWWLNGDRKPDKTKSYNWGNNYSVYPLM